METLGKYEGNLEKARGTRGDSPGKQRATPRENLGKALGQTWVNTSEQTGELWRKLELGERLGTFLVAWPNWNNDCLG